MLKSVEGRRSSTRLLRRRLEGLKLDHRNEKVTFTALGGLNWTEGGISTGKERRRQPWGVERA